MTESPDYWATLWNKTAWPLSARYPGNKTTPTSIELSCSKAQAHSVMFAEIRLWRETGYRVDSCSRVGIIILHPICVEKWNFELIELYPPKMSVLLVLIKNSVNSLWNAQRPYHKRAIRGSLKWYRREKTKMKTGLFHAMRNLPPPCQFNTKWLDLHVSPCDNLQLQAWFRWPIWQKDTKITLTRQIR